MEYKTRVILVTVLAFPLSFLFRTYSLAGEGLPAGPLKFCLATDSVLHQEAFLVLKEAYRRLGIAIEAERFPAERALQTSNRGVTAGEVARQEGLEASYPDLVRVPEPLIDLRAMVFTKGFSFPVEGWGSLKPYVSCYIHGIKVFEQGTAGMRRQPASGMKHAIQMLRCGLCDVALLDARAWEVIDQMNAGPLRELEPAIAVVPLYHYLHRSHEDLIPLVAEELRKMRQEGVIEAILKPGEEAVKAARKRQSFDSRPGNGRNGP